MGLKEIWTALVERATEDEKAIASFFEAHIDRLHEELGESYTPKEYPKWVGGKIVQNATEEEAELAKSAPQPVAESLTPPAPPAPPAEPPAAAPAAPEAAAPAAAPATDTPAAAPEAGAAQ